MPQPARTFHVRIQYREPTYEMYAGAKERPYHWVYDIQATSPSEAKGRALEEFRSMARKSSVSWRREVVLVDLVE